jgi:hypothetical protein
VVLFFPSRSLKTGKNGGGRREGGVYRISGVDWGAERGRGEERNAQNNGMGRGRGRDRGRGGGGGMYRIRKERGGGVQNKREERVMYRIREGGREGGAQNNERGRGREKEREGREVQREKQNKKGYLLSPPRHYEGAVRS